LGQDGEELSALEQLLGRPVYVKVTEDFHQEEYDVLLGRRKEMGRKIEKLSLGQRAEVYLEEGFGSNSRSATAVMNGNLVEALNLGDRVGDIVELRVSDIEAAVPKATLIR